VLWAAAGTPTAVFSVTPQTLRILANATPAPIGVPAAAARPDPQVAPAASGA
jgi:hypothetical protein